MKFDIKKREEKITFSLNGKTYHYLRIDAEEIISCEGNEIYADDRSTEEGREIRQQLYAQQILRIPTY